MNGYLRQSTPATILAGPFLAPGDGVTAKTALGAPAQVAAGGATGFALVKAGARAALAGGLTAPAGWAHDALGYYDVNLAAGDVDTTGRLRLAFIDPANYAPVHMDFLVLSQPQYDWLFGATAPLTTPAPTATQNATAFWTDLLSNATDFNVVGSIGGLLKTYAAPDNADVVTALADLVTLQTSVGTGLGAAVATLTANLATVQTTLAGFAGLFVPGVVSGVATATSVTVFFTGGAPPVNSCLNVYLSIVGSACAPEKLPIVTPNVVDANHLNFTFAAPGFGTVPPAGQAVLVG